MKVKIDPDVCVGTGSCISICPEIFEMGDEGIAVAKAGEVSSELEDAVREAIANCPVEAIKEV